MSAVAEVAPVALRRRISPGMPFRYQWVKHKMTHILIQSLWENVPKTPFANNIDYLPFVVNKKNILIRKNS
ncbi:hypothetical protein YSY22_21190 [Brevibacillus formosus]